MIMNLRHCKYLDLYLGSDYDDVDDEDQNFPLLQLYKPKLYKRYKKYDLLIPPGLVKDSVQRLSINIRDNRSKRIALNVGRKGNAINGSNFLLP
ncbi:hypothetical protein TSAR_008858 [Trichomalopsis sarcophagae]|uniref:Uncharacterized protein n=1 Tax=Trichomalopsis sarcophagae TaxID=543379 RepID=A0A232EHS4_9HYME|nr:hypothetical protein TSAR_008858 [Trichomalopsis sarcophagae]